MPFRLPVLDVSTEIALKATLIYDRFFYQSLIFYPNNRPDRNKNVSRISRVHLKNCNQPISIAEWGKRNLNKKRSTQAIRFTIFIRDSLPLNRSVWSGIDSPPLTRYSRQWRQTIIPVEIILILHRQVEFLRPTVVIDTIGPRWITALACPSSSTFGFVR